MPTKSDKKRTLNLEEKRMLEKLLLTDITTATCVYSAKRQQERDKLKEGLINSAPPKVRELIDARVAADKSLQKATEELRELGYTMGFATGLAINTYGTLPEELTAFDAETKRIATRMSELKREYTLRLFAGGEEAKALFSTLESAIADILRV